jgi:glycerol-3-phosphate O-acyltransferase / dihydroxyacetone phosphate acyltransferase
MIKLSLLSLKKRHVASTVPYSRHLCYWTKSSLFVNPVSRAILVSSGTIPVHRNFNSGTTSADVPRESSVVSLFSDTSIALASGQAVCVFPEGTSYTEPRIMQMKDGAARAALEYARWMAEHRRKNVKMKGLTFIPVGIAYTDKSQFGSRVCTLYSTFSYDLL